MMFPVIQPASPEKVYYQAARILCEYHEDKANIGLILKNSPNIYPFHVVCRNFRNWSSHNKFENAEMPAKIFALLFCITLHTYFDTKQENEKIFDNLFDYEKIYFISKGNLNIEDEQIEKKRQYIKKGINLLNILEPKNKKYKFSYPELTWRWGRNPDNKDVNITDILLPILLQNWYFGFETNLLDIENNIAIKLFEDTQQKLTEDKSKNEFTDLIFQEAYEICCGKEK